ncbi:MAG: hypothetical protein M1838_004177 [Thelocarpon superellum]|nr:MAG: hypothetical protein M1838_004177 [Thelocarpon superellum]
MAYLVPIHKPTSVRHALKLSLLRPDEECLVVAKANQLHVYRWANQTLTLEHTRNVYGQITMLDRLRPSSSPTDHLFVGTDRWNYFTVSWDPGQRRLCTEKTFIDSAENGARKSKLGERCLIDPGRTVMALDLFEGIMMFLPIISKVDRLGRKKGHEIGNLGDPALARLPELFVRDSTFLHGAAKPKLAILWEDGQQKVHLRVKEVLYTDGASSEPAVAELADTTTLIAHVADQETRQIIPVPKPVCGLLLLGESQISHVDEANNEPKTLLLTEPTAFVAWVLYDDTRFLLADEYGRLSLLQMVVNGTVIQDITLTLLGQISRASVMVVLDQAHVFVGSHQGDSQLIAIDVVKHSLELVQTISNIAPILDFTVMDLGRPTEDGQSHEYSSGQTRIVTGSGAFQNGSLRSVRSGVGLEDQGILGEMEGIGSLFSLRSAPSHPHADTALVSFAEETRVFHFTDDGDVEERESYGGLSLSQSTLAAANVAHGHLLQITPSSVLLTDPESGMVISQWIPPSGQHITDASTNDDAVLVAVGGTRLVSLDIRRRLAVCAEKEFSGDSQIACVTVPSFSSPRLPALPSIGVVGFWHGGTVSMVNLDTLEVVHDEVVGDARGVSVPRVLLMTQVLADQPPSLFVSMADGVVFTFAVDATDFSLQGRNSIVLGTQQARLQAVPRGNGLFNVFATCEHPSLIYGSEGRIVYAAVTADTATCVCPFDAVAFPDSIMIATPHDLKIATVDEERQTHVKDLEIRQTVRRIAYSSRFRAFALGTIRRRLVRGVEVVRSHVQLVDEINFELLDSYELDQEELVESLIPAELSGKTGEGSTERFLVGTGYLDEEPHIALRGRVLVFEVSSDRKLQFVTASKVKGACRCLDIVDNRIVAALVKTVVVYALDESTPHPTLVKKASYRTSTAPVDLAVTGRRIAVADLMKSLAIVEYRRGEGGMSDRLDEVARHYQTTWATAVAHVAEDTFLESDAEGNLLVLHQNRHGVTDEDQRRLETTSEMRLGEMVNRMRSINVAVNPDAVVIPRAFLATVEGAIYLFALISPTKQDLLMRLQGNIARYVDNLGHLPFNKYRAYKSSVRYAEEPFRFVDGALIEQFLDCDEAMQEQMVSGLGIDAVDVRAMVEGLKRLH